MGISMLKLNHVKEAMENFQASNNYDTAENPGAFDGMGQCYHKLRKYNEALGEYQSALDIEGKNVDYLLHRAQCHYDMGNYDLANKDFELALTQDETDSLVHYK